MEKIMNISNPINDDNTLLSIIKIYSDNEKRSDINSNKNNRFYNKLLHFYTNKSDKHISKPNPNLRDELYSEIFEIWKNNIINMTPEKFNKIYGNNNSIDDEDFHELVSYLNDVDSPTTYKEVISIVKQKIKNPVLNRAFNKYFFPIEDSNTFLSSWNHITSSKLAEGKESEDIKHELYINVGSKSIDLFTTFLLTEFFSKKINFNFKFDKHADRDDSIIIYSSDKELKDVVGILENVKNSFNEYQPQSPNQKKDFKIYNPPVTSEKINGWIGYGPHLDDENDLSYLELMGKEIVPNAISDATKIWFRENKDKETDFNGYKLNYLGYFSKLIYDEYTEKMYKTFDQLKYNPKDLKSHRLKRKVFAHIANFVEAIGNDAKLNDEVVSISLNSKEEISYSKYEAETFFNSMAFEIAQRDDSFLDIVRENIEKQYEINGIEKPKLEDTEQKTVKLENLKIQKIEPKKINTTKTASKPKDSISNIEISKRLSKKYLKNSPDQVIDSETIKSLFNFINLNIGSYINQLNDIDDLENILYSGALPTGFSFTVTKKDLTEIINEIKNEKSKISDDDTER